MKREVDTIRVYTRLLVALLLVVGLSSLYSVPAKAQSESTPPVTAPPAAAADENKAIRPARC